MTRKTPVKDRAYKLEAKQRRNEQMVSCHRKHPDLTYQQLGEKYGVSKQRVKQILDKARSTTQESE